MGGLGGLMSGGGGIGSLPFSLIVSAGNNSMKDGLVRRPGKEQCPFLLRTKSCPFGAECRFDHAPPPPPAGATEGGEALPPLPSQPNKEGAKKKDIGLGGKKAKRPQ